MFSKTTLAALIALAALAGTARAGEPEDPAQAVDAADALAALDASTPNAETRPADASRHRTEVESREVMARLHAAVPALAAQMRKSAAGYITVRDLSRANGTALGVVWRTRQEIYLRFDNPQPDADGGDLVLLFTERVALGDVALRGQPLPAGAGQPTTPDGKASPFTGAVWIAHDIWAYRLRGDAIANDGELPGLRIDKDDALN